MVHFDDINHFHLWNKSNCTCVRGILATLCLYFPGFIVGLSGNITEFLLGYCVVIKPALSRCASTKYE